MDLNLDISFNINDQVKLKLTDKGLDTYINYWANVMGVVGTEEIRSGAMREMEAKNGFITMKMWQMMAIFGPHLNNGGHQQIVGSRVYLVKYNAVLTMKD